MSFSVKLIDLGSERRYGGLFGEVGLGWDRGWILVDLVLMGREASNMK